MPTGVAALRRKHIDARLVTLADSGNRPTTIEARLVALADSVTRPTTAANRSRSLEHVGLRVEDVDFDHVVALVLGTGRRPRA